MNLRNQPAGQIVNRRSQLSPARSTSQQICSVKNIGIANQPVERWKRDLVHRFNQRKSRDSCGPRKRASFMIELAEIIQERKSPNIGSLFAKMPHPVPDVILDARTSNQSRSGIDNYAHLWLN